MTPAVRIGRARVRTLRRVRTMRQSPPNGATARAPIGRRRDVGGDIAHSLERSGVVFGTVSSHRGSREGVVARPTPGASTVTAGNSIIQKIGRRRVGKECRVAGGGYYVEKKERE